ncbi:MAG: hypothetical protein AAB069_06630, partial [Planctomycetota bacterium]
HPPLYPVGLSGLALNFLYNQVIIAALSSGQNLLRAPSGKGWLCIQILSHTNQTPLDDNSDFCGKIFSEKLKFRIKKMFILLNILIKNNYLCVNISHNMLIGKFITNKLFSVKIQFNKVVFATEA